MYHPAREGKALFGSSRGGGAVGMASTGARAFLGWAGALAARAMILPVPWSALRGMIFAGLVLLFTAVALRAFGETRGEDQLDQVLKDCPQLRGVAVEGNTNWQWLVSAFGNNPDFEIHWTRRISPDCQNVTAESSAFPNDDHISYLRVDGRYRTGPLAGQLRSPDEVMSGLVFELNNVRLGPAKKQIATAAASGRMDRAAYVLASAHQEFTADQETAAFYHATWVPFCASHHLSTSPRLWYASLPPSFSVWIARFPLTFWYPWRFFGDRYDRLYGKVRIRNH